MLRLNDALWTIRWCFSCQYISLSVWLKYILYSEQLWRITYKDVGGLIASLFGPINEIYLRLKVKLHGGHFWRSLINGEMVKVALRVINTLSFAHPCKTHTYGYANNSIKSLLLDILSIIFIVFEMVIWMTSKFQVFFQAMQLVRISNVCSENLQLLCVLFLIIMNTISEILRIN